VALAATDTRGTAFYLPASTLLDDYPERRAALRDEHPGTAVDLDRAWTRVERIAGVYLPSSGPLASSPVT